MAGDKHLRCSFCGKSKDSVKKFISGPNVYICNECISLCNEILAEEEEREAQESVLTSPTPIEIKAILDDYVIGQEEAKRALAVSVYSHYQRVNNQGVLDEVEIVSGRKELAVGDHEPAVLRDVVELLDAPAGDAGDLRGEVYRFPWVRRPRNHGACREHGRDPGVRDLPGSRTRELPSGEEGGDDEQEAEGGGGSESHGAVLRVSVRRGTA